MSFNTKLSNSISNKDLQDLGFIYNIDNPEDHRGDWWEFKNKKFSINIDAWYEVSLFRLNPDSDPIKIIVYDKHDLESLMAFIED